MKLVAPEQERSDTGVRTKKSWTSCLNVIFFISLVRLSFESYALERQKRFFLILSSPSAYQDLDSITIFSTDKSMRGERERNSRREKEIEREVCQGCPLALKKLKPWKGRRGEGCAGQSGWGCGWRTVGKQISHHSNLFSAISVACLLVPFL